MRLLPEEKYKFCASPKTWISNGGGYAEYMVAEADGCTLVPDKIAWDIAAPLFCGGFSAMSAYKIAKPQPGERVGVIGIGGLGHIALQIAKSMGHEGPRLSEFVLRFGTRRSVRRESIQGAVRVSCWDRLEQLWSNLD